MQLIVYSVKDLAQAKAFYTQLLGVSPYVDQPYYVGYKVGDQEIGLDPHGQTSPIGYRHVDDIHKSLQSLLDAGGELQQDAKDVGGGKQIALVKDPSGNLIGLVQNR